MTRARDLASLLSDDGLINAKLNVEAGNPIITLKDTTDNDDHHIYFTDNLDAILADINFQHVVDDFNIGTTTGRELNLFTNNTTALTIDTSQNVTFAGTISSGAITSTGKVTAATNYVYGSTNYHFVMNEDNGASYIGNINGSAIISSGGYYHGANLRKLNSGVQNYSALNLLPSGEINFEQIVGATAGSATDRTVPFQIDTSGTALFSGTISSGAITSSGQLLSKVVAYSANQSGVYLTAASTSYTGASTHWGTHGARHSIKTNSGGVPRITVDWEGGEKYSLDNSGNAVFSGSVTWSGGSSTNANTAYTYSQVGHLPLAGGTLTGSLAGTSASFSSTISAGSTIGNLNTTAGIGQAMEYGSTGTTTLRFDSDNWRLYAGGGSGQVFTVGEGGNVDVNVGNFLVGGTTVIDSSRNLTNIGTISSGAITSSSTITWVGMSTSYVRDARQLNAIDDRDIAPEDLSYSDDFRIFFAEKGQIEAGTAGSTYLDLLYLNSYSDASGGDANALAFHKGTRRIYHYQADQTATNWGTPKSLAYTDDNISGTAAGLSGTPNITVGTVSSGKVNFGTSNVTPPTPSDAVTGARLNLYPAGSGRDYTIGIESATMWFNSDDHYKWYSDGALKFEWDNSASDLKVGGQKVWNAGNDGSGSGLDADLLDGSQGSYYDHRRYTDDDTYLGGYYVSGGTEKPNDNIFGAGKLKIAMLGSANIGGGTWNDVLWMSTYTGGDVKRSTALVSSKYDNTSVWVNKVNYDSASWGTNYLFWNSGNDGSGSGLDADLLDGLNSSQFMRSDTEATTSGSIVIAEDWGSGSYNSAFVIQGTYPSWETRGTAAQDKGWLHHQDVSGNYTLYSIASYTGNSWTQRFTFNHGDQTFRNGGPSGNVYYHQGNDGSGSGLDADLLDGLNLHTGRNNEANKVVRTDTNGYIQAGWINTTSGSATAQFDRVYASNDGYIRYYTTSNFLNSGGMGEKLFNNQARNHSTQTNFNDTSLRAGVNYLQGGTNGPTGTASHQWYGFRLGLGNDYGTATGSSGHYASELYWSRKDQTSNNYYIYTRDMESGTWGSWVKMHAGYADSAGSVAYANVTGTPTLGGGTPYLDLATGNYGTVKVDDDRGVSWAGYAIRDDWTFMANGASNCGIYNDTDNEWAIYLVRNGATELYYDGVQKLSTTSAGVTIAGDCRATIFYDSNDTFYYLNPASGSNLNTVTATAYYYASDERLKENISTIPNALQKVEQLRGVEYNLKETGERQIGVIAQEVEKILPEVVRETEQLKAVNYGQIVGLLIEGMKEQQAQIQNLQKELGELKDAKTK